MLTTTREGNFCESLVTEAAMLTFISLTTQSTTLLTLAGGGTGGLSLLRLLLRDVPQRLQLAHAYLLNQTHLDGPLLLLVLRGRGRVRGASKAWSYASNCCV